MLPKMSSSCIESLRRTWSFNNTLSNEKTKTLRQCFHECTEANGRKGECISFSSLLNVHNGEVSTRSGFTCRTTVFRHRHTSMFLARRSWNHEFCKKALESLRSLSHRDQCRVVEERGFKCCSSLLKSSLSVMWRTWICVLSSFSSLFILSQWRILELTCQHYA